MFKPLILVVTAIAGVVFAQLPACAQTCVVLPAACPNALPDCICKQSGWIQNVACCVFASCTTDSDRNAVISYANGICQPVGVTLPTTADNCNNGTAVSTAPASTSMSATGSAASSASSMASSASSMASSASSSASSAASSISSAASSAASSASSAAASAASTGLGSKVGVAEGAGFVGALMGFFALL